MKKYIRLVIPLLFVLLLAMPAFAQGRVVIDDTTGQVNRQQVQIAAQSLVNKGATVVVLVSNQTGSNAQTYAQNKLTQYGVQANPLDPSAIIYLVALDQRNAYIYYGSDWNAALGPTY